MENKQTFQLISIFNTETHFKRGDFIPADNADKLENFLDVNVGKQIQGDDIVVYLTVKLSQELDKKAFAEINVTSAGVFKKSGDILQNQIDSFCDINAPAIIFPFIREIIASVSSKGGLQTILIPPINFIEANKEKKKDLESQ